MCLHCYQSISDEDMIKSLENATDDSFIDLNTTSISHLTLNALGLNGEKARNLAIGILERFIKWRKTQPRNYMPKKGLEVMTSASKLEQDLIYIKNSSPDYSDKHLILQNYEAHLKALQTKSWCSIQ